MDVEIIKAVSNRSFQPSQLSSQVNEFGSIVGNAEDDDILNPLITRCTDPLLDALEYLRALFVVFKPNIDRGREIRAIILEKVVSLLISNELRETKADEVVQFLLGELSTFPTEIFVKLCDEMIKSLEDLVRNEGKFWDFLPAFLNAIETEKTIAAGDCLIDGCEFKSTIIDKLSNISWPPKCLLQMVTAIREINLKNAEFAALIKKLVRQLKKVEIPELPPFVYQLLLFSARGEKVRVLNGIIHHFKSLDDQMRSKLRESSADHNENHMEESQLRQSQGTVILHINFAVKQDRTMGQQFLQYIKKEKPNFTPFFVSLLLSLGRIQTYEDKVLEILKGAVINTFRETMRREKSPWYSNISKKQNFSRDIEISLVETLRNSTFGWDHVLPSLISLGFALVDEYTLKKIDIKSESYKVAVMGASILQETFQAHEIVRNEILEQIFSRIITNSVSSPIYIDLLQEIISTNTSAISDLISRVKETFDYISFLSPDIAKQILKAVDPLLKSNRGFQDHIVLVMRKAMFNRELNSRLIAVNGFLQLLDSLSDDMIDLDDNNMIDGDSQLQKDRFEILGFLRRCLTQQPAIRECLYLGLSDTFERNFSIRELILDMLLSQFLRYYDNQSSPPLKLNDCIDKSISPKLIEPIAQLLNCIQHCVIVQLKSSKKPEEGSWASLDQLRECLSCLVARLITSELDEFELDANSDFTIMSTKGQHNTLLATQLLGIYEVLIKYTSMLSNFMPHRVLDLYSKYNLLLNLMSEKAVANKKTKIKKTNKRETTLLGLDGVLEISKRIKEKQKDNEEDIEEEVEEDEEEAVSKLLRSNNDFLHYILSSGQIVLQSLISLPQNTKQLQSEINYVQQLLSFHKTEFVIHWEESKSTSRNAPYLALENMDLAFTYLSNNISAENMAICIETFKMRQENDGSADSIISAGATVFREINNVLMENNYFKEAELLLHIVVVLCEMINDERYLPPHSEWIEQNVLKKMEIDNINFIKMACSLYFQLTRYSFDLSSILRFAKDLHIYLGDPNHTEKDMKFRCINNKTVNAIFIIIVSELDQILDEIDWSLSFFTEKEGVSDFDNISDLIFMRLFAIIKIFTELSSGVVMGAPLDHLLKMLIKFYRILKSTTKQLITAAIAPPPKYQMMVEESGKCLAPAIYNLFSNEVIEVKPKNRKKESTLKPNLIFEIERYEAELIEYSNKSKIELMRGFKRSQARDFRIVKDTVNRAIIDRSEPIKKKRKVGEKGDEVEVKEEGKPKKETKKVAKEPRKPKEKKENPKPKQPKEPKQPKQVAKGTKKPAPKKKSV